MSEKKQDIDQTALALKYPDYHKWRDLDAAYARGGRWPNGEPIRLSDPEMKPQMDELLERIQSDPEFARGLVTGLGIVQKPKYMSDIDETFEALKKPAFKTVRRRLEQAAKFPLIINPMTFEITVARPYHNIITGLGWTVDEFEHELNYPYDNK